MTGERRSFERITWPELQGHIRTIIETLESDRHPELHIDSGFPWPSVAKVRVWLDALEFHGMTEDGAS